MPLRTPTLISSNRHQSLELIQWQASRVNHCPSHVEEYTTANPSQDVQVAELDV